MNTHYVIKSCTTVEEIKSWKEDTFNTLDETFNKVNLDELQQLNVTLIVTVRKKSSLFLYIKEMIDSLLKNKNEKV